MLNLCIRAKYLHSVRYLALAIAVVASADATSSYAAELIFGTSTALTGPSAELGLNMKLGIEVAFAQENAEGGIRGQQLRLIALDDGYEPKRAAPNTRLLIDKHKVLAIVGNVGTPTAVVAAPIAIEKRTLFYGAYTGAGVLRKQAPERYVVNYRASYAEETRAIVDALIDHGGLAPEEIAFFTQRDAYGDAGYVGGITALKSHGLQEEDRITHCRYERNTDAVESAAAETLLADPPPRAVIMVGTYKPCAEYIRTMRSAGADPLFVNVSFVGAEPLRLILGEKANGVVVTQVVPHFGSDLPIARDYRLALDKHAQVAPTFTSFEGYVVGRILVAALQRTAGPIDRESIIDTLENMGDFDIGFRNPLSLSRTNRQASHSVWPTSILHNQIKPLLWSDLGNDWTSNE